MNLINNRYRVITNLSQDRSSSSYLVSDVIKNHERIQLNIINSEFASEAMIDFYVAEFIILETINHTNINKVFDFGLVRTIDNKKVENKEYFYTNYYIEDASGLKDISTNIKENDILNIFMQLCKSVNYLHIRGFVYGEINDSNIIMTCENNKPSIMLKDLPTVEIEKQSYNYNKGGRLKFKAPEQISEEKATIFSDIYAMGVVLLTLCNIDINDGASIDENILTLESRIKKQYSSDKITLDFYSNLIIIIKKMTQQNLNNRYKTVNQIVKEINKLFNKNYKAFKIDEIERLNFNTKIVGRNSEITKIMGIYEDLVKRSISNEIVFIQGDQGIGKTRLLKEIEHLLNMKKANVYSSFTIENGNNNRGFIDILKKIVSSCDDEMIKKYESELIKLIPELGEENNVVASESLAGAKEKYRLISRIYRFIEESISNKPTVFIIDNADYLDEFSMELLEYINIQNSKDQNIMIILSYSKGKYDENNKFQQLLKKNAISISFSLDNLNNEETAIMIQGILSLPMVSSKFSERVYGKTYGNPLFVEETLKDFVAKRILHINENNGKWYTPFDNLSEMPIASTMEQALLNQIKEINKSSYDILSTISIFNTAVSIEIIEKLFIDTEEKIKNYINELCSKGILCKKIEDMGFVFDFNNKVLKNLIYNRLSEEDRKVKHQTAASLLENLFKIEGKGTREELIYHLEKAKDKDRIVKYCIELAEKMKSLRIMDEAIIKYEKALSVLSEMEDENRKIEVIIEIGDIYISKGNLSTALETYNRSFKYSMHLVEKKIQVDVVNRLAMVYMKKNEVEKAIEYIRKGDLILLNFHYMEGYLENKRNLANVYVAKQEYHMIFDLANKCIEKCGSDYKKYQGYMYNILGIMYSKTSKTTEALEHYEKAFAYFEEINYPEGMCNCLNNIGVIYGDHYQDREMAISYYNKLLVICEENNVIESQLVALVNLGICHLDNFHYDVALKYFKDVLEKSTNMGLEGNIFFIYNYLSYVYLKMGNSKEAYEYHLLAQKELEQYPIQGKDISLFYQMGAEIYYILGDIDKAYNLIKKALAISKDDGTIQDNNSKLLLLILEIEICENSHEIVEKLKDMSKVMEGYKNNIDRINMIYEISIVLYEKGYIKESISVFEADEFIGEDISADTVKLKVSYVKGLIYRDERKITNLMEALDLSKRLRNKSYQWSICSAIGDYYWSKGDYFYAVNYHFEACEIIKNYTMQLPEEIRINYINACNRMRPFRIIKEMSNTYEYDNMTSLQVDDTMVSNHEELKILFSYNAFSQILNNKSFIESSKKIYSNILPPGIHNINDIIKNMCEEPLQILDVITKLIASMALSTRSLIISEGAHNEYNVVASSDGNYDITDVELILQRVKETRDPLLVSEAFYSEKNIELKYIPSGMKAIMCIPIFRKDHCFADYSHNSKRVTDTGRLPSIKGYLYLESERVLNNFNEENLNKCLDLTSFISFILENHFLKITSSIDKLTGTLTRRFLEDALSEQVDRANAIKGVFSIIMFDLDNFKGVNDRFGHQTGDHVLRDVSKVVRDSIRKNDICGRYGGEEFIVILPEADTILAYRIAERIRQNIHNKKILGSRRELTVSMGIATYPSHAVWKQELVEKADQALYVAKENGKNRCQVWEDKFSGIVKGINKLLGIVSGNVIQDSRNVLAMVELIDIIKAEYDLETKVFNALGRIIETTEAHHGMFFIISDNKSARSFGRKIFKEDWCEVKGYNENIIESVTVSKQALSAIDWDTIVDYDLITGMPNWNSVLVVPIIKSAAVLGILYLTVPVKVKEFKLEDLNFTNMLAQLLVGML